MPLVSHKFQKKKKSLYYDERKNSCGIQIRGILYHKRIMWKQKMLTKQRETTSIFTSKMEDIVFMMEEFHATCNLGFYSQPINYDNWDPFFFFITLYKVQQR